MQFFKDLLLSLRFMFKAFNFSTKKGLKRYFVLPAFVNLFLVSLLVFFLMKFSESAADSLIDYLELKESEAWYSKLADGLVYVIAYALVILVSVFSYKAVILILLSPALGILAEKVQLILNPGRESLPFTFGALTKSAGRGIFMSVKYLLIELLAISVFGLLGFFIPVLSVPGAVIVIIVQCYVLGVPLIDYRNEFWEISRSESEKICWRRKGFTLGVGLGFYLLVFIPFFGVLFGPMLMTVAAGTGIHEIEEVPVSEGGESYIEE